MPIKSFNIKSRFKKEYGNLDPGLQQSVNEAIADLMKETIPAWRRFHSLSGYRNPRLYTIDVTPNKAYKISLEMDGEVATLRRIASHGEIDRAP